MTGSEWLTVNEIMAELKISRRTLYNWIAEGLPVTHLSKRAIRIKRRDLELFLEQRNRQVKEDQEE